MRGKWWEHKNMRVVRNVFFKCDPKVATHKARFLLWSEKQIYTLRDLLCKHTFLGLLAKIKCSICSYQFNIWYTGNPVTILNEFFRGASQKVVLAQQGARMASGWHYITGRSPLHHKFATVISTRLWYHIITTIFITGHIYCLIDTFFSFPSEKKICIHHACPPWKLNATRVVSPYY